MPLCPWRTPAGPRGGAFVEVAAPFTTLLPTEGQSVEGWQLTKKAGVGLALALGLAMCYCKPASCEAALPLAGELPFLSKCRAGAPQGLAHRRPAAQKPRQKRPEDRLEPTAQF